MDMQLPEILPEFLLLLRTDILEVLPTEDHNAPLCNQKCKFILLLIAELAQLQALYFSTNSRSQLFDRHVCIISFEQMWLRFVCEGSFVSEFERLRGWENGRVVIDWQIVRVLVLQASVS